MILSKQQLIIIGIVGAALLLLILVFTCALPILKSCSRTPSGPAINLEFWGVGDEAEAYAAAIAQFRAIYPRVAINYRKLDEENYENELLNAYLNGKAPDIFMIRHNSLPQHYSRLAPLPQQKFNLESLRSFFPEVVERDFAPDGLIFALPLTIDTLVLYYNRDIFDQASITTLPATWEEFQNTVLSTRKLDSAGRITRAGAAIGGSEKTIDRAADILSLLMIQSGTEMTNKDFTQATFNSALGKGALEFYLKFTNPANVYYTWNDNLKYSLDAFGNEEAAMIFDYGYRQKDIEKKNPFLKFAKIPMVQPSQAQRQVNYADYFGYAVSNRTLYPLQAWDFVLNLTTSYENAKAYLLATGKPPALRPLINNYIDDPQLGIFAKQALTSRSFPQADSKETRKIFSEMIADILQGRLTVESALNQAVGKVTQLMTKR
jgi:multiple sugar transport system substrate-binding protein